MCECDATAHRRPQIELELVSALIFVQRVNGARSWPLGFLSVQYITAKRRRLHRVLEETNLENSVIVSFKHAVLSSRRANAPRLTLPRPCFTWKTDWMNLCAGIPSIPRVQQREERGGSRLGSWLPWRGSQLPNRTTNQIMSLPSKGNLSSVLQSYYRFV